MNSSALDQPLGKSLEDYLETVYELVRDNKVARVKEIADRRQVKPGSVTPAMKRLAELGLVRYAQHEFIDLTPAGEEEARRILARHQLLTRFLVEVLDMPVEAAERDACALEHGLSDEGTERLARFFEFLKGCGTVSRDFLDRFHNCHLVNHRGSSCNDCPSMARRRARPPERRLADLPLGEQAVVSMVDAQGAIRQRLIDMGILPDVTVRIERVAPSGDPLWIRLQGFQVSLRRKEAEAVRVVS